MTNSFSLTLMSIVLAIFGAILSGSYYLLKLRQECGERPLLTCVLGAVSNTQKEPTSTSAIHEKQAQEARRAAEPFKRERDDAEEERIRIEVQQAAEVARRLAEEKERAAESAKQRAAADEERRRKDNLVKRVKV